MRTAGARVSFWELLPSCNSLYVPDSENLMLVLPQILIEFSGLRQNKMTLLIVWVYGCGTYGRIPLKRNKKPEPGELA